MQDLQLDNPEAGHLLALFLGRAIVDEALPPSFLAAVLPSLHNHSQGVNVVQSTGSIPLPSPAFSVSGCAVSASLPHLSLLCVTHCWMLNIVLKSRICGLGESSVRSGGVGGYGLSVVLHRLWGQSKSCLMTKQADTETTSPQPARYTE